MTAQPLKVLVVSDHADVRGGADEVAVVSALGLAARGWTVGFFGASGTPDPRLSDAGIQIHAPGLPTFWEMGRVRALGQAFHRKDCATALRTCIRDLGGGTVLIHAHSLTQSVSPGAVLAAKEQSPLVFTAHDYLAVCPNGAFYLHPQEAICPHRPLHASCLTCHCDSKTALHKVFRVLRMPGLHRLVRNCRAVVFASEFSRGRTAPDLPGHTPCHTIPYPLSIATPKNPSYNPGGPVGCFGRLTTEKGVLDLARAASQLGLPLRFVGEGPALESLRRAAPGAEFLPWQAASELPRLYRSCRALAMPSRWPEPFGLTAAEAYAQGVPTLAPRLSGVASWITDRVDGALFENGDHDSLVSALAWITEPEHAASASALAHFSYQSHPSTEHTHAQSLESLYLSILKNP